MQYSEYSRRQCYGITGFKMGRSIDGGRVGSNGGPFSDIYCSGS